MDTASRYSVATSCLHRSLVLWWLLERRGFEAALRFGARKHEGRLEAHAWVEHAGAPVHQAEPGPCDYAAVDWVPLQPS